MVVEHVLLDFTLAVKALFAKRPWTPGALSSHREGVCMSFARAGQHGGVEGRRLTFVVIRDTTQGGAIKPPFGVEYMLYRALQAFY